MLTANQIDMVAYQLGDYLERIPDYRHHPVTQRYLEGTSISTDIELLSYLCDMLLSVMHKEHNLVNLISVRLKLIEARKALQDDCLAEAAAYADELLLVLTHDLDKLSDATRDKATTLLTRYRLSRSMAGVGNV